jgi:hypothetical protein
MWRKIMTLNKFILLSMLLFITGCDLINDYTYVSKEDVRIADCLCKRDSNKGNIAALTVFKSRGTIYITCSDGNQFHHNPYVYSKGCANDPN